MVKLNPNLPNVLIIGDSTSIGYTGPVRTQLKGKANVIHNPGNAQGTTLGLIKLKEWLGNTKWDVIHFNWGLHDLKHMTKAGTSNNSNDLRQADPPTYKANMEVLVKQLKATGAALIFAATTPYPEGVRRPCRSPEDAAKYNDAALKIMKANGIPVNDLYSLVLSKLDSYQRPVNVHFTKEGSKLLADQVVAVIKSALQKQNAKMKEPEHGVDTM